MSAARAEILARIRAANRGLSPAGVERGYRTAGEHPPGGPELLDLLEDRLLDYRATVRRCDGAELPAAVAGTLAALGVSGIVLRPPGVPAAWAPEAQVDSGELTPADLDRVGAVITACRAACAETGTIALDHDADQGRRAATLVPDVHLCVVRAEQVVQTVPELLARLTPTRPLTFVSGPSATSDIELDRVEGVHGPRTLAVLLVVG